MDAIAGQVHRIDAETFLFSPALVRVLQDEDQGLGQQVA
jgi:FtsZ-interacting cell division protein YlmF